MSAQPKKFKPAYEVSIDAVFSTRDNQAVCARFWLSKASLPCEALIARPILYQPAGDRGRDHELRKNCFGNDWQGTLRTDKVRRGGHGLSGTRNTGRAMFVSAFRGQEEQTMSTATWDVITIGGGPGATPGAQLLAAHGRRVAIIEQGAGLGGTCLFEGCIPSKIYLETAARLRAMRENDAFGIVGDTRPQVNLARLRERKAEILAKRVAGANQTCAALGITVFHGVADIVDAHHVRVTDGGQTPIVLEAQTLIVSPGSVPKTLNVPGADADDIWTSADALELSEVPKRLCIIGGGYIGVELATLYQSVGSQVQLLEMAPRILESEDPLVAAHVIDLWKTQSFGVSVETGVTVSRIADAGNGGAKRVDYRTASGAEARCEADRVLIAVGRAPHTAQISWANAGITLGAHGEVPVNEFYQTVTPNVYAPGDVNGQIMLAHAATRQSLIAAQHILGLSTFSCDLVVPHVVFSFPEIAAVGADSRALADHPDWRLTRWSYGQDARALIVGDTFGYAQLIWDRVTHRIQGLQVVGTGAGELVEEATSVITQHGTLESLVAAIHPHPTLSEIISEVATQALSTAQQPG
jgi:dihydrolipoamide dehydrogenase